MIGRRPKERQWSILLVHVLILYFFVLYRRPLVVLRSLALDVKAPIMALMNTQTGNIFALVECNKRIYFFSIKCSKKKVKKCEKMFGFNVHLKKKLVTPCKHICFWHFFFQFQITMPIYHTAYICLNNVFTRQDAFLWENEIAKLSNISTYLDIILLFSEFCF